MVYAMLTYREQKQYGEAAQREVIKSIEAINTKIHIAIEVGGLALVGVLLSKLL